MTNFNENLRQHSWRNAWFSASEDGLSFG